MGMGPRDLTGSHLQLIEQADILVGGKRLLDYFKDTAAQKKPIGRKIDDIVDFIKKKMKTKKIVVLASGDPLFYGIGGTLVGALGSNNVYIHPNISTVAAAFARIKEPWSDVRVISLHGKKKYMRQLFKTLEKEDKIAVLTDPENNPARLAQQLIEKELVDFQICVLEAMGSPSERFNWYSLNQAAAMEFADPNIVILKRGAQDSDINMNIHFGMPDSCFAHQEGLITKSEVRAVSLSKLKLLADHTLWDLGAGSGSISIEAAIFVKKGDIFAVEKRPERIEQIIRNKQRFKVKNLKVIQSDLPEGLANLPAPDRIFIGGGGKNLKNIIIAASGRLKAHGIIVINTVLIANLQIAKETLQQLGFHTDIVQVHISRAADMPWDERLEAQNPVWIITGMRKAECGMRKKEVGTRNEVAQI